MNVFTLIFLSLPLSLFVLVTGMDTKILPILDEIIEIPMYGYKNSLNVAACAPVVLYEILRQWKNE
jgi:tRNA G18 (ribose-2'-O)-methylase SpoU